MIDATPSFPALNIAVVRTLLIAVLALVAVDGGGGARCLAAGGDYSVCGGCHPENTRLSHPVGMVPSMAVPVDLPLDAYGQVTCTTCHLHHDQIVPTGTGMRSLRRAAIATLCRSCHRDEPVLNHRGNLPFAHAAGRDTEDFDARGVDRRSLACLGCHDSLHPQVGEASWGAPRGASFSVATSHPIGVQLGNGGSGGSWRQPVDPNIHLFGGRVGCPSCHDPFSLAPEKLVMDNHGSKLCFGCHAT